MGSFNISGAMAGLLGEGARQANMYADRLSRLDEKKLEESIYQRREKADLVKQKALKDYQYEYDKETTAQKQTNALELQAAKPKTDGRSSKQKDFEYYQSLTDEQKKEFDRNEKPGKESSMTSQDYEIINMLSNEYPLNTTEEKSWWKFGSEDTVNTRSQRQIIESGGNPAHLAQYDYIMGKMSGNQAGILRGSTETAGVKKDKEQGSKNPANIIKNILSEKKSDIGGIIQKGIQATGLDKKGRDNVLQTGKDIINWVEQGEVDPSFILSEGARGLGALKDAVKIAGEMNQDANKQIAEANRLIGEGTMSSVSKVLSWIKKVMTAKTNQKEAYGLK